MEHSITIIKGVLERFVKEDGHTQLPNYCKMARENPVFGAIFEEDNDYLKTRLDVTKILSNFTLGNLYNFLNILVPLATNNVHDSLILAINFVGNKICDLQTNDNNDK